MLGNTDGVGDRGNGNSKPWVPGRSVPVIHSVALCQALSHEIILERKKKNLFFFSWPVSHLHKGLLQTQAHADVPGQTPQWWWGSFARIPPTPTVAKSPSSFLTPCSSTSHLSLFCYLSPEPTFSNCSACFPPLAGGDSYFSDLSVEATQLATQMKEYSQSRSPASHTSSRSLPS